MATVDDILGPDPRKQDPETIGTAAGLPHGLYSAVIGVESGGNVNAVSAKGAVGASQVLPTTAAKPGYGLPAGSPHDLNTGARYLKKMIDVAGGDVAKGLAMYNAGAGKAEAGKGYANKVIGQWKPSADDLLGPNPDAPQQSPLAKAPPQAQPQQQAPQQAQQKPPEKVSPTIMDAINRPADRTVELMQQSTEQTLASIKAMVQHPGPKTALNAALNVIGLPFSPVTSLVDAFLGDPATQLAHQLGASPKTDPYVRAAAQTILPIAGAKSAMLQKLMGEEGAFLAGTLAPGAPPLKPGQSAAAISQNLIRHDQQSIARDVQMKKSRDDFLHANPDYVKHDEELYHAGENPGTSLTPRAAYLFKTFLEPIRRRNQLYVAELDKLGVKVPELVDPKTYMHRQAIEQTPSKNLMQRIADTVDPTGALSNVAPTKGFGVKPEIFQKPHAGAVESPITGEKGGYVINPEKDTVDIYKNGKVIDTGHIQGDQIITKNGGKWDMSRGTTKEIESHTPVRYQKSALSSMLETQRQLTDAVANAKFIQGMKTTPEFLQLAKPPGSFTPKDWTTVNIPGYHGLDDWKMDKRLAEVLNDYTMVKQDPNTLLQGINRIIQGSIFINPVGHIMNVEWHAAIEAGLFGGVTRTIEGAIRAVTPGEKTLTRRAIESVVNKDADYMRYVRESPGMKGANNYIRNFSDETLKLMGKDPRALDGAARIFGLRQGADLLRVVYGASNKTLWGVGDMILMKSFLGRELERGGTEAQIASAVHGHIPDYVVPSRVLGVRGISQMLQSPLALGFSRYEYNRLESYAHLMSGLVKPSPGGTRAEAMDQVMALAFHAAVTYPMLDYAIQHATGNPHATFHGYGPFIFTENAKEYEAGKKNVAQATTQSLMRPGAAVGTMMEVYQNRDWKNQPIYGHGGKFNAWLASKTYPTQALYRMFNPPKGVTKKQAIGQFLLEQGGIKSPTPEQYAATESFAKKELAKRKSDKP